MFLRMTCTACGAQDTGSGTGRVEVTLWHRFVLRRSGEGVRSLVDCGGSPWVASTTSRQKPFADPSGSLHLRPGYNAVRWQQSVLRSEDQPGYCALRAIRVE